MQRFAGLYLALDETTRTNAKIAAMAEFFRNSDPLDAAWAIWFLSGNKIRQIVPSKLLRQWAGELSGIPDWLFNETYQWVGDLAETMNLVLPPGNRGESYELAEWVESKLLPLRKMPEDQQRNIITEYWARLSYGERFVLLKLLTGGMRVGVSKKLVVRAIADVSNLPVETIAHRLMGDWSPSIEFYKSLINPDASDTLTSQPYPFCLANPVETVLDNLGDVREYLAEWKWDGIRAQLIKRNNAVSLWSRGEERLDGRFPEIEKSASFLPDGVVLDGEIIGYRDGSVLPFQELQRRINRKQIGPKLLSEVPVIFLAFDIIEAESRDIRSHSLQSRRSQLVNIMPNLAVLPDTQDIESTDPVAPKINSSSGSGGSIFLSPTLAADSWSQLAEIRTKSRAMQAEGLMLKSLQSPYTVGRTRGAWWKWKVNPYTIDAVLIYAQRGHGKRASLYTDYTFAVWDEGTLVPFAKAYSGLSDEEIQQVDKFIRQNIVEKFGPVRSVKPHLVMELAFENIQLSKRHKSGIAVRFPRIARWRTDKLPADANTLSDIKTLLSLPQEST